METCKAQSLPTGAANLFREYCSSSSIHGIRYFGCESQTWCEKFWWFVVFVLSLGSCGLLISKTYQKWEQTPVIVSFAEKYTPVWQIPLPAVTVCAEMKVRASVLNFSRAYNEFAQQNPNERVANNNTDNLLAMMQLCDKSFLKGYFYHPHMFLPPEMLPNKSSTASYATLIQRMSPSFHSLLGHCELRGEGTWCKYLFPETLTDEGICGTFNAFSTDDLLRRETLQTEHPYLSGTQASTSWTLEQGYKAGANLSAYPYRTLVPGTMGGLSATLFSDKVDLDYLCRGPIQGYKVILHPSNEYPQVSKKFIRIPLNHDVTIALKPQMITTSSGLLHYTPERRQCFFNHERYLRFFREYTQDNCELECLTNFTLQHCGCVRFSMPRTNETAVCETNQISCLFKAEELLLGMGMAEEQTSFRTGCHCLPACVSVQYDTEITQTHLDWQNWMKSYEKPLEDTERLDVARFNVYFKEAQFITSKRSELYGLTDFLANCGGLLGLCLGVSLLSLVELGYFCLIRPALMWREKRQPAQNAEETVAMNSLDAGTIEK